MTDATGSGGAADGAGAGGTSGAGTGTGDGASGGQKAWHDGIDQITLGFWQNKGLDPADPRKVAEGLTKFYREVERYVGAPPDQMIRIPQPNAAEADIKAYWNRVGVPAEGKDYDLSGVKFADGKELDTAFADMLRSAMIDGRVPKDRAAGIAQRLIKHMEANDAAELAERTANVKAERELLDKNWGANRAYNEQIAKRALEDLGKAAGLTAEQATKAWDAISVTGGIGASYAMEMLRMIGARMGESPFVNSQPGSGTNNQAMSKSQALAEIESLKADRGFYKQLVVEKSVEARRRWDNLHKIAYAA